MASLEDQLGPDEWFIFAARPHSIRYVPPIALALCGLLLRMQSGWSLVPLLLWLVAAAVLAFLARETVRASYIVTNRRVIVHSRLAGRVDSLPLEQIVDIVRKSDGLGRWVKGGRIVLTLVDGRSFSLPWIQRARTFRRLALQQQSQLHNQG